MSTTKDCGHSVPCGCGDTPLTTGAPCPDGIDCTGNPCAENFSTDCIIYTGDTLPQLGLNKGMSISDLVKILATAALAGTCIPGVDPTVTCNAITSYSSTNITDTTITIDWVIPNFATDFDVHYSIPGGLWTVSGVLGGSTTSYQITGLTASTEYWVRISTICAVGGPCMSPIIAVTTLNTI